MEPFSKGRAAQREIICGGVHVAAVICCVFVFCFGYQVRQRRFLLSMPPLWIQQFLCHVSTQCFHDLKLLKVLFELLSYWRFPCFTYRS